MNKYLRYSRENVLIERLKKSILELLKVVYLIFTGKVYLTGPANRQQLFVFLVFPI